MIMPKFQEDLIVSRIIQASKNAKEGKVLRGNLDDLLKKYNDIKFNVIDEEVIFLEIGNPNIYKK